MDSQAVGVKKTMASFFKKFGILIALFLIIIFFALCSSRFLTVNNILNLLRQVSIRGIISVGMAFVILSGGIDLSVGANTALCGIILALMLKSGVNTAVCVLVGVLVGSCCGAVNGFFVANRKMPPFIVTMGTSLMLTGVAYVITEGKPVSGLPDGFLAISKNYFLAVPIPVWIMLAIFLLAFFLLNYTVFGRHLYAVGGNEKTALVSGINTQRTKAFAYTLCGAMCGLAATVLTSRVSSALSNAGEGYENIAIASCVIGGASLAGGKGTMFGVVIGILLMGVINNGMDIIKVNSYYQKIVMGAIILVAVLIDMFSNKD